MIYICVLYTIRYGTVLICSSVTFIFTIFCQMPATDSSNNLFFKQNICGNSFLCKADMCMYFIVSQTEDSILIKSVSYVSGQNIQ